MTVESKYNIGDKLWTMDSNFKAKEFEVASITIGIDKNKEINVRYYPISDSYISESYEEKYCFNSKNEMIEYLFK